MGRKTTYNDAIADAIIEHLDKGTPLEQIVRMDGMPGLRTVHNWRESNPEFAARFAQARAAGFDHMAADCLQIADDSTGDMVEDERGRMKVNPETAQRAKLRIETRLKLLAVWARSKYGEHATIQVEDARPGLSRADALAALQAGSVSVEEVLGRWVKPVKAIEAEPEPETAILPQPAPAEDYVEID